MKLGWKAGAYLDSTSGVSRAGSSVTNSTCTFAASSPNNCMAPAEAPSVVGQISGHWVKPKKRTTTLPLKSASVRGLPLWSLRLSSRPQSAPLTSVALNLGGASPPLHATRTTAHTARRNLRIESARQQRLQIVVDQQRSEEEGQVGDRPAEGLLRDLVGIAAPHQPGVLEEDRVQNHRGDQIEPARHADELGHQRDEGQADRV